MRGHRAIFAAWEKEIILLAFGERQQTQLREPRIGINDQPFVRRQVCRHLSHRFNHIEPTEQTFERRPGATIINFFEGDSRIAAEKLYGFTPANEDDFRIREFAFKAIDDDAGDGDIRAERDAR